MNDTGPAAHELLLEMTLDAPRSAIWRCMTEPDLMRQWFAPRPWTTLHVDVDPRAGGRFDLTMQSPEGEEHAMPGIYLEVIEGRRIVTTDAFTPGWVPSEKPFMTAILEFEDAEGGGTAYRATVRHWSAEDRKMHEDMGFHEGWTICARQLEELARHLHDGKPS